MNDLEQLESRLSQIKSPAMPADMESRIRQRLATHTAKPRKAGPWAALAGLIQPSPAFAAQLAALLALVALAVALFMHDAGLIGASPNAAPAPAVVPAGPQAPNYQVTFSVPTLGSGKASAPAFAPAIAPPPPPRHHR